MNSKESPNPVIADSLLARRKLESRKYCSGSNLLDNVVAINEAIAAR
jgi:hypothetical protein